MGDLKISYQDPEVLRPQARNPRTHSARQIAQITRSIQEFGFTNPILVDAGNSIIAGHGRVLAAKQLRLRQVPTVRFDHMTEVQVRAYVIADNKLAENAGWDRELLALELKELSALNIDLTLVGLETPEIDLLLGELNNEESDAADKIPEVDRTAPAVTRMGDLWLIGDHRLLCGDSTKGETYIQLLGGRQAQMVFTDPPYNVSILGHVSGLGKIKHREFSMASGEMTKPEFTTFLRMVFAHLVSVTSDGAIHFICMDWRHVGEVLEAAEGVYAEYKNLCVWAKTNAGMGSLYRSQHELIFVFKNGSTPHINNIELGSYGRNRTNIWSYAGVNSFGHERDEELAMHPTVKPVVLVADAILDCSHRSGIVLDVFAGSGTTLIACEKVRRFGYGIELDPLYVDTILRRFDSVYGLKAVHAETGLRFDEMHARRVSETEALNAK